LNKKNLTKKIKEKAINLGYNLCGIIPAVTLDDFTRGLDRRMKDFPEVKSSYEDLSRLAFPPKEAKSIIVCIGKYTQYKVPELLDNVIGKFYLFDERLKYSNEYQASQGLGDYLKSLGINYTNNTISARWAAEKAGLGFFGKNNFIYTKFGSYVWINTWAVDVELDYLKTETAETKSLCCDNCRKCIDACPTKALSGDFSMNKEKCIAALSFGGGEINKKELWDKTGAWIYGCDICQDVCPMNKNKLKQTETFPLMAETTENITFEKIMKMDEKYFFEVLYPRFWYIGKDKMWVWKCNVLRAMVNSGDAKYHNLITDACSDKDDHVRETALWARNKLQI